ncbi:MAG: sigma 54-interacting transcriptional regulator [Candidatus Poribacteria bacterium]|nr:sigma 54-interacting transcriptional regulator [Candidatus Poribacteria bacterium]
MQEGEIRRLGEVQFRTVDLRLIVATNRDLQQAVQAETFREDLFFRLNVFPIVLPPLRERTEDIPALVDYFIEKYNRELDGNVTDASPEAMQALFAYAWPGNIRELENVIKRLIVMVDAGRIRAEDLPPEIQSTRSGAQAIEGPPSAPPEVIDQTLAATERARIADALSQAKGNQSKAARILGITRQQLRYRLQKHGIMVNRGGP